MENGVAVAHTGPSHNPPGDLAEAPISATFKEGAGFDAALVTLRAHSVDAWLALLDEATSKGLFESSRQAATQFRGRAASTSTQRSAGPPPSKPNPNGGSQRSTTKTCSHGTLAYTEWQGKHNNRTYRAYKCPLKVANWRDPEACDAIEWVN